MVGKLITFEMFQPKLSDSNQTLSFKVRGIGEKNKDLLTGLRNKRLSDASLFVDDGTTGDQVIVMDVSIPGDAMANVYSLSEDVVIGKPYDVVERGGYGYVPNSFRAGNCDGDASFKVNVTLKNGVTSSGLSVEKISCGIAYCDEGLECYGPSGIYISLSSGGNGELYGSTTGSSKYGGALNTINWLGTGNVVTSSNPNNLFGEDGGF